MALHSVPRTIQTVAKRTLVPGDITMTTPTAFTAVPGTRMKFNVPKNSKVELAAGFSAGGSAAGNLGWDFWLTYPDGTTGRLGQDLGLKSAVVVAGTVAAKTPVELNAVLDNLAEGEHTLELQAIASAGNMLISAATTSSPITITVEVSPLIYPVPGVDS